MMAKNPEDRYQSAREIVRDLVRIRDGLNVTTAQLVTTQPLAPVNGKQTHSSSLLVLSDSNESALQAKRPSISQTHWLLLGLACLLATLGGVGAYFILNGSPERTHDAPAPHATGLPDVRPPDKLTTTRERELLAVLNSEATRPEDAIKASVELGLLYVKEHRLGEATERFERLKRKSTEWRDPIAARSANITGRLGLAVVLAHENNKAEASNKLFLEVVTEPPPKFGGKFDGSKGDRGAATVSWTLLRYPDLSNAVSDALNRNAANLGKTKLEPPALEQLRSPQRVGKKE
jgi:serine/threonine-protein kinase